MPGQDFTLRGTASRDSAAPDCSCVVSIDTVTYCAADWQLLCNAYTATCSPLLHCCAYLMSGSVIVLCVVMGWNHCEWPLQLELLTWRRTIVLQTEERVCVPVCIRESERECNWSLVKGHNVNFIFDLFFQFDADVLSVPPITINRLAVADKLR